MPVRTKDLDKVIAEVIATFEGVEEIIALLREGIVNYIQRKDILAVLAGWKITAVPVTTWHDGSV